MSSQTKEERLTYAAGATDVSAYLDDIPAHVPLDLVKPYPFIRGEWTYDNPFKTLVRPSIIQ
jgi:hypothetical protein